MNTLPQIDEGFFNDIVFSAGLAIKIEKLSYVPLDGEGNPLKGVDPMERFVATCDQLPNMRIVHATMDTTRLLVFNQIRRTVKFCVVVDGVEIFGSAEALRAHGLFIGNEGMFLHDGPYSDEIYVRMAPLHEPTGDKAVPYHRFYARSVNEIGKVYNIMKARARVQEITVGPSAFERSLIWETIHTA